MNRKSPPQQFGTPPDKYDQQYMLTLVRSLSAYIQGEYSAGDLLVSSMTLQGFPTLAAGLIVGSVYLDENGFLRTVRAGDVFAGTLSMRVGVGTVTAT